MEAERRRSGTREAAGTPREQPVFKGDQTMADEVRRIATLTIGSGQGLRVDLPIYIRPPPGPDVHRHPQALQAQAGVFTYDPGFTSTASCDSTITFIDGDKGDLAAPRLPHRPAGGKVALSRSLLPAALRRIADAPRRRRTSRACVTNHTMLHEQMMNFVPRLPPRRASHGDHGGRGRRDVGVLSRQHRHQRRRTSAKSPRSA